MATLGDVRKRILAEMQKQALFGVKGAWRQRFDELTAAVGTAIMEETGLSGEEATKLPSETVLGPKAAQAYEDFLKHING